MGWTCYGPGRACPSSRSRRDGGGQPASHTPGLRRTQLAGPAGRRSTVRRSRSRRAHHRRWPGRAVHRGPAAPAGRGHPSGRAQPARRRQLAQPVPLTRAAQRGVGEPPAVPAVPGHLADLHPQGPGGRLVRVLRGVHGAQRLDVDGVPRRQLRPGHRALDRAAGARRRRRAHPARTAHRDGLGRQRHPLPAGDPWPRPSTAARPSTPASSTRARDSLASG